MADSKTKKRKVVVTTTAAKEAGILDVRGIADAEERIVASPAGANAIVDILNTLETTKSVKAKEAGIQALFRVFLHYKPFGKSKASEKESAKNQFLSWMHGQYLDFIRILLATLSASAELQIIAVHVLMQFVREEGAATEPYRFPNTLFERIVAAMVGDSLDREALLNDFNEKFMIHDDVRHYVLKGLAKLVAAYNAKDSDAHQVFCNNVFMLMHNLHFPVDNDQIVSFYTAIPEDHPLRDISTHRHTFSDCWLAFLRIQLPSEILNAVLLDLNESILPHLVQPKLIIDFLTDAYNMDGSVPILALHGLFTLIYQHNLDYPDFYPKLYALFEPSVLLARHRPRFFHLAHLFLTSTHLPAYLVAAFVKRISRLMLTAPPAGAILLTRLMYNLLRRHPTCKSLIHRTTGERVEEDPFRADEIDPAKSHALESSVWETESLARHYHPDVSGAPDALRTPALNRREFDIEKSAKLTYSTMLQKELRKPLGDEPPATVFTPSNSIFPAGDVAHDLWRL